MKFSTLETPGAAHAARSASRFSAHDRPLPQSFTVLSAASTVFVLSVFNHDSLSVDVISGSVN
jgi:hypothetical protein